MGKIKDFLFGKKVIFVDSKVGNMEARVKRNNPHKRYTWTSEHLIAGQMKPTIFLLDGNYEKPYKNQLNAVHQILDSLDKIMPQIDKAVKNQPDINQKYKEKDFYLSDIIPYEAETGVMKFEVIFEPVDGNKKDYISCLWENGKLYQDFDGNLTEIKAE
ncbi:MAG: hypothetical protein LBG92_11155 [Prevotellaceae bacterium]|jgi:hypothetical protein|nr:hypothetical protein [Prevotellaceae bacterium]